jgi:hypothetical protein
MCFIVRKDFGRNRSRDGGNKLSAYVLSPEKTSAIFPQKFMLMTEYSESQQVDNMHMKNRSSKIPLLFEVSGKIFRRSKTILW